MKGPIRVLIVDDSAFNRRALAALLEEAGDVQVVGRAADGAEGLRLAEELQPDVITLDLAMPQLDGFTFLRLLQGRAPTPVIVISSYARRGDVFKALELGAFDFLAKPSRAGPAAMETLGAELLTKVRQVRLLRKERAPKVVSSAGLARLVVIGASTGGPPAISRIVAALPAGMPAAIVIAQHMPPKFTAAFAERLGKGARLPVREAQDGEALEPGVALVVPGGVNTVVSRGRRGVTVSVLPAQAADRYVPSIDRLFASAAEAFDRDVLGLVLTGMGDDGVKGAASIRGRGGRVIAEDRSTAVIWGMPKEVVAAGEADEVLPLERLAAAITSFARG